MTTLCQCPNAMVHGDELCPTTITGTRVDLCDWCESGHRERRPMTAAGGDIRMTTALDARDGCVP